MKKRNVIIDCDPGIDDSLALMLALSMEELLVVGITIVCGNGPVDMGFANAKKILQRMGRLDIPVCKGAERPLKREYVSALETHGADALGESFLPEVPGYEQPMDAVEFMERELKKGNLSVIALGPMTNLARLIQMAPEAFDQIEELVSMGGNFRSHGNCSPVAEYNYWADPDGAALVYKTAARSGKKIHMVGLDVTRRIVLTPDLLEYFKRLDGELGAFVQAITKFYFDFHWEWEHLIGCVINDPLAVAYFVDRTLCEGFEAYIEIDTEGISMGQSVVDEKNFYGKKANGVILTKTDSLRFFKLFFGRLLKLKEQKLDLLEMLVRP
ncbi:MAG: nucleoside hydrolase [Lachnospiraceae bacterium]|nr:nucleoside hydrolase [Lachnospiraceae bacterium]